MSARGYAVRVGLARGLLEFRAGITNVQELLGYLVVPFVMVVVLFFQRDNTVAGTSLPLATLALPGVLGMLVGYGVMIGGGYGLSTEREDGTLLRAKAIPNGMLGYLSGGVLRLSLEVMFILLVVLIPALFFTEGIFSAGFGGVLTLLWVLALGLLATIPIGMIIGSLMNSPRAVGGWGMLLVGGLTAISGIFYPVTALAGWLQQLAQYFPIYWLGIGMRSALLPADASAVELGGTWRHLETVGVLGAWAVAGLLIAPVVLRRVARRESGSSVAERRQKAMQRI